MTSARSQAAMADPGDHRQHLEPTKGRQLG